MNSEQTSKNIFMDTTEVRCYIYVVCAEAVVQRCSVKKVFLEILQNSQEKTCARVSFLIRAAGLRHRCFPVNIVKFLRTPFLTEHLWWLLLLNLDIWICKYIPFPAFHNMKQWDIHLSPKRFFSVLSHSFLMYIALSSNFWWCQRHILTFGDAKGTY